MITAEHAVAAEKHGTRLGLVIIQPFIGETRSAPSLEASSPCE